MRFADLRNAIRPAPLVAAGCAWLVLLASAAGEGVSASSRHAGVVTEVVKPTLYISGKPKYGGGNYPFGPGDTLALSGQKAEIRFTITDVGKQVSCTLWTPTAPSTPGNIKVEPKRNIALAFNGGTSICNTPPAERKTWKSWVKKHVAQLQFQASAGDPVFSVVVGASSSVIRVHRGAVVVIGKGGATHGVVVGKKQQVSVTAATNPSQPVATTTIPPAEQAVLQQVESKLPPVTDTTPPVTKIVSAPAKKSSLRTAVFRFQSDPGVTFSCSFDGSPFTVCTSPQRYEPPQYPPFAAGSSHTLTVKATDAAGNVERKPVPYTWTIDTSRIAFESTRTGNADIFVMDPVADPTGKNAVDLTNSPATDADPAWSPNEKQIAFQSNRTGTYNVWVMNADGSGLKELTHDKTVNDTNPTWSPDGKLIVFESNATGRREIYVMSSDGTGKIVQLTSTPSAGSDANFDPAWSPLGDKIAFASTRDGNYEIYVMNADGTNQARLTNDPAVEFNPAWSPDGKLIAFHSDANRASKQIWVMRPDGSEAHVVVSTASDDANPVWSPDGREIAFQGGPPGATDLWMVGADGSDLTRLTYSAGDDEVPDWR